MTCYNLAGDSASDTITAYVYAPPTVDVKVNGLDYNQTFKQPISYNATWTSTNASTCTGVGAFTASQELKTEQPGLLLRTAWLWALTPTPCIAGMAPAQWLLIR